MIAEELMRGASNSKEAYSRRPGGHTRHTSISGPESPPSALAMRLLPDWPSSTLLGM